MKSSIYLLFITAVLMPLSVDASSIVRSGDTVSVAQSQALDGDFYGLGGKVLISGQANHDVYVAGGSVTLNAPVEADLSIVGGSVQVHSTVKDDVRILGGEITIGGVIEGDLVILGGVLNVLSTAEIKGDIMFIGGEIEIEGKVDGSILGLAESVRINAPIKGDVRVTAGRNLSLGSRAEIQGNIEYQSATEIIRAQESVVLGNIQKKSIQEPEKDGLSSLIPVLVLLFASLTAYMVLRRHLQALVSSTMVNYGTNGLIGLGVILLMPFVSILLMVSVLGFLIGLALLFAYILLIVSACITSGVVLGTLMFKLMKRHAEVQPFSVVLGSLLFALLPLIPVVGPLLVFALLTIVLGGICTLLYKAVR